MNESPDPQPNGPARSRGISERTLIIVLVVLGLIVLVFLLVLAGTAGKAP